MKIKNLCFLGAVVGSLFTAINPAFAQGTAFTYQGRLNVSGNPANGTYDFRFRLSSDSLGNNYVGSTLLTEGVPASNGLFTVTLDFGANFPGADRWLEIGVRSNAVGGYTILMPLQALTPSPYAITANSIAGTLPAAQLSGTVGNGQLANSTVTLNAGTGLSGGGAMSLGGSTTLNNVGVLSVTGNSDITATPTSGNVALGSTATSANTPSMIVKRDGIGNFSAGSIALSGTLDLPGTTSSTNSIGAGIITINGGLFLHAFGINNLFAGFGAGNTTLSGDDNAGIGFNALAQVTSGRLNTAVGSHALVNNTNGSGNTAVGSSALFQNLSGNDNTADGSSALGNNTTGSGNTANGVASLRSNLSGNNNTASGANALYSNIDAGGNTANGVNALFYNKSGFGNTAAGFDSLFANVVGNNNTAVGVNALYANTNGSLNTAAGISALLNNPNGNYNTAIGGLTLYSHTNGDNNLAVGYLAGYNLVKGSNNIFIDNGGEASDNRVIRIGTQGTQTNTFIAGVSGTVVSDGSPVYVTSSGKLGAGPAVVTRYMPISVGNILNQGSVSSFADNNYGIIFPTGQQSGGQITFPLPTDYVPGTIFNLDLYLVPSVTGTGNVNFFVRWAGLDTGDFITTGASYSTTPIAVGTADKIQKQSFVLPAIAGSEFVVLTIRRDNLTDTYANAVYLCALRLSYQATR